MINVENGSMFLSYFVNVFDYQNFVSVTTIYISTYILYYLVV